VSGSARADFFVSYTQADRAWAEWIGWQLEQAGYTVIMQAWDFLPGTDWVHQMHTAVQRAERTLAVLSPAYLESSEFGEAEWRAAFAADPSGEGRRLIPVRVLECHPEGLLKTRVYVDLAGRDEQDAAAALLRGVGEHTGRPGSKPAFPGGRAAVAADRPRFPGTLPAVLQARDAGMARPTGVDEHMWSRQADTYVAMLQYQGSGMVEGYIETATDREWAVRDELMAKAAAFASDEVRDLWQQSALANLTLQEYVDENWPELTVVGAGVLAIEDATEKDPELRRLRQASAQASKQLAVQIRAELDVARHGRRQ